MLKEKRPVFLLPDPADHGPVKAYEDGCEQHHCGPSIALTEDAEEILIKLDPLRGIRQNADDGWLMDEQGSDIPRMVGGKLQRDVSSPAIAKDDRPLVLRGLQYGDHIACLLGHLHIVCPVTGAPRIAAAVESNHTELICEKCGKFLEYAGIATGTGNQNERCSRAPGVVNQHCALRLNGMGLLRRASIRWKAIQRKIPGRLGSEEPWPRHSSQRPYRSPQAIRCAAVLSFPWLAQPQCASGRSNCSC